jgi:tellurite resistance protein
VGGCGNFKTRPPESRRVQLNADEATLMLASLAVSSDGQCDAAEEDVIRARLAPHLKRLGKTGEERAFLSLYQMMGQKGPEWTLKAIRAALPKEQDRLEALRTAVEIVRSDGSITSEEMDHLAEVADELGLSEKQLHAAMTP